jgi:enoyl-CoA hydratase/carnithine racemase
LAAVELTADGPVAVLTVDNPPLNLFTMAIRRRLMEVLQHLQGRTDVRAIVLAGAGDQAFSAGSDVREFSRDPATSVRRARTEHDVYRRLQHLPQPVVAALHGHVLGSGLELALACDLRVADETTRLGFPEVTLGILPAGGGTHRLPRLVGVARAKELMLLGERVDAAEALRIGLVNRVVPAGEARPAALDLAIALAERPALAVRAIKRAVEEGLEQGPERGEEIERELISRLLNTRDAREGVAAFQEGRPASFEHR